MTDDLVKRLHDKIEASKIYDDDITLASIVRVIKREELLDADCKIEGSEMSNDLVKRLRAEKLPGDRQHQYEARITLWAERREAADRIEKLEAALEKISRERTLWGAMRKADHALGKFDSKALEGNDV